MSARLRRGALGLTLVATWSAPYVLPFGEDVYTVGWYAQFVLDMAMTVLLVASVVEDLPRLERAWPGRRQLPWLAALVVGGAAMILDWALFSKSDVQSPVIAVHRAVLTHGGAGLALPAVAVLVSRTASRPLGVGRVSLLGWLAIVALFVVVAPPYLTFADFGQLTLFLFACWMTWVHVLDLLRERWPRGKWRTRLVALALGTGGLMLKPRAELGSGFIAHANNTIFYAGIGLVFTVLCVSAGEGLAWAMRRSPSLRARIVALGLACSVIGLGLTHVHADMYTLHNGRWVLNPIMTLTFLIAFLAVSVSVFATALSRGFSRSLEDSVRAISQIGQGNLEVALDESGRDEVAQVARSFNRMVGMLREAEFLEKINTDLRSRSAQLAETLKALQTAQADLVRSERMASVATLVKGIAHELNNPINYIAGNMTPLRRYCAFVTKVATELADGRARQPDELQALTRLAEKKDLKFVSEDLGRLTADIAEGARRAQLIIMDLQSLTAAAQRELEQIDLHRIVRQTISLLGPRALPGVRLEPELLPVPVVTAYAGQIEQVLVNLADNALRAVGSRGTVRITVGTVDRWAQVKVSDDGPGMTAEVKRQAFEPFFTTRSAGEGSGLGLAIVASIVRAHQGTVTLESEPGHGTQVEVRLPLDAQPRPA